MLKITLTNPNTQATETYDVVKDFNPMFERAKELGLISSIFGLKVKDMKDENAPKVIQELLAPSGKKGKNQFQQLMELLPNDHKAKWFAGSALNTGEQSMASVMSTALSRLNAFLDSELEQLLCFDTEIDAEVFCSEKSAIFVIMPEENPNTFFMISLILQQLFRKRFCFYRGIVSFLGRFRVG